MRILFMCVANSARSQLAEGLAKELLPGIEIKSAGSEPGKINPYAIAVMQEIGIDISQQFSKGLDNLSPKFLVGLDYVITLCAEEVCPTIVAQTARKLHWPFKDPASREPMDESIMMSRFREARDAIKARIEEFKAEILK